MKKWQIEKSEKPEISKILEKLFRVFLFPNFRFCPTGEIENSYLKVSEKKIQYFQYFWGFRVFDLAIKLVSTKKLSSRVEFTKKHVRH